MSGCTPRCYAAAGSVAATRSPWNSSTPRGHRLPLERLKRAHTLEQSASPTVPAPLYDRLGAALPRVAVGQLGCTHGDGPLDPLHLLGRRAHCRFSATWRLGDAERAGEWRNVVVRN